MPQAKEVTVGEKFNRWEVIRDLGIKQVGDNKYHYILAKCECGNKAKVIYSDVYTDHSKSCGCYNREVAKKRMETHGLSDTRMYRIWKDMRRRCNNPNRNNYKDYGGRGISVCEEWDKSFMEFYNWAMSNGYDDDLSIDRIDNNGNYEPNNCRWILSNMQHRNTRKNRKFKATSPNGSMFIHNSQAQFAEDHNLERAYINSCLVNKQKTYKGWTFEYID